MHLPLYIFQVGDEKVNCMAETRDISSGGVSFLSSAEIGVGDRIDYMITLSGSNPPVRIRCLGKVLRIQRSDKPDKSDRPAPFEVAVTMERYSFVRATEMERIAIPA
jgi:hypothetical protein